MRYPCFQRMGYERLRSYFTWRTRVRCGEFLPVSLSYVFLYAYELLMCIGVNTPQEALAGLLALREAYREQFPAVNEYFPMWLKDFPVYYGTEQTGGANDIFTYDSGDLEEWAKFSSYDINKSKFYTEESKLMQDCFAAVIRGLTGLCAEKNIRVKDLFVHTGKEEIPWQPFRRALFHPWLKQADRVTELPCGEVFYCKNNTWTTLYNAPYAHRRDLTGFIIKKTEACVRNASDYKKITADTSSIYKATAALAAVGITPTDIAALIEKNVAGFFCEKNRVVVNINRKNLERIREEADDITDKLVVEDGALVSEAEEAVLKANSMRNGLGRAASENAELAFSDGFAATDETDFKLIRYIPEPLPVNPPEGENDMQACFKSSLSAIEAEALKLISDGCGLNEIKAFSDSKGIMLEILVDSINEKAMDIIGDNILELGDTLSMYEEYAYL